ncbi:MAG TPA: hypothetical protein PLJ74_06150 [Myxococcota bacterium]|nr:hypothetical protein [Myxococcota bacterium]
MKALLTSWLLLFLAIGVAYAAENGFNAPPRPDAIGCQDVGPITGAVEHAGGGGQIYSLDRPINATKTITGPFYLAMYDADTATSVALWSGSISVTKVFSTGDEVWSPWVTVTSTITSFTVQPPAKKPSSILCFHLMAPTELSTPTALWPTAAPTAPIVMIEATPVIDAPAPTSMPPGVVVVTPVNVSNVSSAPSRPSYPGLGIPTNDEETRETSINRLFLTGIFR